jgi:hypothetical protein
LSSFNFPKKKKRILGRLVDKFNELKYQHTLTFEVNRKSAENLIHVAVSMADGKEIEENLFKNTAIDEALQICENESVFTLPNMMTIA